MMDQQKTPVDNHHGVVYFLIAFIGCCILLSGVLILLNTSRRRRHTIWFRICRRYPCLARWIEPINTCPAKQVFDSERLDQLFPKHSYVGLLESCRICLEDIEPRNSVRELPCGHIFHTKCIEIWLTKYQARCALCSANIDSNGEITKDVEQQREAVEEPARPTPAMQGMPYGTSITEL